MNFDNFDCDARIVLKIKRGCPPAEPPSYTACAIRACRYRPGAGFWRAFPGTRPFARGRSSSRSRVSEGSPEPVRRFASFRFIMFLAGTVDAVRHLVGGPSRSGELPGVEVTSANFGALSIEYQRSIWTTANSKPWDCPSEAEWLKARANVSSIYLVYLLSLYPTSCYL